MKDSLRAAAVLGGVVALFLVVQVGALALLEPFENAGLQSTENPQNPLNSVVYVAFLLVATAGILLVIKYDQQWVLRAFVLFTSGFIATYVFGVVFPAVEVAGVNAAAYVPAAALVAALYVYPEWWVVDAAAPMLTLASGVMELRLPIVLVVPTTTGYSFLENAEEVAESANDGRDHRKDSEEGGEGADGEEGSGAADGEREAYFIGLGDAVMPTILVASAAFFLDTPTVFGVELAALTAMAGTLVGLLVLMRMVFRGRAHAGLPLLNGGAIAGYLVGALAAGIPLVEALGLAPYV
jgi:presenilin-like A22 family membrane protease